MRIDKYLKVSRLIKRRSVACEVADSGRIMVNDKVVKPAYQLKINDIVTILFGNKQVKIKVINLTESIKKEDSSGMYEILEESSRT